MKFIVLGTSEFTLSCAKALLDTANEICALVSILQNALPLNSVDIAAFAAHHGIHYHEFEDINDFDAVERLRGYRADYIFSSWPKILKKEVLEIPQRFSIGTHPTVLPYNRGRHPLHWLIALGISQTALSFFKMDENIDTGKILLQYPFMINSEDVISDGVAKMNSAAYEGTKILCKRLYENPSYAGEEQDNKKANYWRKRTPHDVTLDLRMSASFILRTVRSFGPPYPCANLIFHQHVIKISGASVVQTNLSNEELQRIESGKIINIKGVHIRVKVEDGIVDLECATPIPSSLLKAKYIHPPSKYLIECAEKLAEQLV